MSNFTHTEIIRDRTGGKLFCDIGMSTSGVLVIEDPDYAGDIAAVVMTPDRWRKLGEYAMMMADRK